MRLALAVDGWAVTFGSARRSLGGLCLRNVTTHPPTASVPTSYYSYDDDDDDDDDDYS